MSASRRLKRQSTKSRSLTGDPFKRFKGPSVLDKLIARRKEMMQSITEHSKHASVIGDAVSRGLVSSHLWAELMQIDYRLRNEFNVDPERVASSQRSYDFESEIRNPVSSSMDLQPSDISDKGQTLPPVSGWFGFNGDQNT